MKKRNGFTLVELLGVIVILAILALITIPIISNVVNDVRIKSLKASAYGLIEAGDLYYAQYGVNSNTRFDIDNNQISSTDTTNLLTYKGVVKEGTVIISKKGQVTVCITDGKNSAYKNYNEDKVTTKKGKCEIFEGSSIVYLDGEATIDSYNNEKLTEIVNELQNEMKDMKDNLLDKTYPVGSIYISTIDDSVEDVRTRFGGTWEVYGNGRTLMSSTSQSEQIGGASSATFTTTGTVGDTTLSENQMPSHTHIIGSGNGANSEFYIDPSGTNDKTWSRYVIKNASLTVGGHSTWIPISNSYTGGSQSHTHSFTGNQETINTVPPYITVYMYKRTA